MGVMDNVIFVCNYAADYEGNFLASLIKLEEKLKQKYNVDCSYVFPECAQQKDWAKKLSEKTSVTYCEFSALGLKHHLCKIVKSKCLIHTHFIDAGQVFAIRMATRGKKAKIVYHMHNRYGENDNLVKKTIKRLVYYGVYFVGVSSAVYSDLCSVFDREKCFCVPNAVSLERLGDGRDLNRNIEMKSVLILGTHYTRKGVDLAVEAVAGIGDSNIRLTIITHNIEETREFIEKELGKIPENIKLSLPVENIGDIYRKTDIFLSPSRSEAFGYAVVEAAYCGCYVIATDIPGQNTMKDIPGIKWVMCEDVTALADEILNSRNQVINVSETKEYIVQHYSLNAWCKNIINTYEKLGDI